MTRSIDTTNHTPGKYVKITINHDSGDSEDIKVAANPSQATVRAQYKYCPADAIMATESPDTKYGNDRRDAHAAIRDALAGLDVDDAVLQTIDRLERVGHWMDDQDPTMPDDFTPVDVVGRYKPLRSGQDMLLVQADKPTSYGSWTPSVRVADDLPPVDELRDDLDDHVENRVTSNMVGQERKHYREEVDGRITADITPVESLQEAVQIVRRDRYGDDIEGDSDGGDGDSGGQTTLAGY